MSVEGGLEVGTRVPRKKELNLGGLPPEQRACPRARLMVDDIDLSMFGITIRPYVHGLPTPAAVAASLLGQINALLVPLQPVFALINAVVAVADVLKAAVPPNPFAFADALAKFLEALTKLLKMMPQLAVPALLKGVLRVAVVYLQALLIELEAIEAATARAAAAERLAAKLGVEEVAAQLIMNDLECAQEQINDQLAALRSRAQPLAQLMAAVGGVAGLIGIELPGVSLKGGNVAQLRAQMETTVKALEAVIDTIPVPG